MLEELRRKEGVSYRVVAIDLIEARREKMKKILDAIRTTSTDTTSGVDHGSLVPVVEVADREEGKTLVEKWTDGLGCHAILEVRKILPFHM